MHVKETFMIVVDISFLNLPTTTSVYGSTHPLTLKMYW